MDNDYNLYALEKIITYIIFFGLIFSIEHAVGVDKMFY